MYTYLRVEWELAELHGLEEAGLDAAALDDGGATACVLLDAVPRARRQLAQRVVQLDPRRPQPRPVDPSLVLTSHKQRGST